MLTVIFAGGKGSRLGTARQMPKPLVNLGGQSLVHHVMQTYASQGYREFVLLAGHRAEELKDWSGYAQEKWAVRIVDTGSETQTGGRLRRLNEAHPDLLHAPFFLTYADGLADVNLAALLDHHARMKRAVGTGMVTLSAVNPVNRFGKVSVEAGMVSGFSEKLVDECGWVNGGFYVVDPEVLRLIPGDPCVWERDILPVLASSGRLAAYQHPGDFLCIDTPRDLAYARDLCRRKERFWLRWAN